MRANQALQQENQELQDKYTQKSQFSCCRCYTCCYTSGRAALPPCMCWAVAMRCMIGLHVCWFLLRLRARPSLACLRACLA